MRIKNGRPINRNYDPAFSFPLLIRSPPIRCMGLGETPRRLSRKRYRYSSREKCEDVFGTALYLMQTKPSDAAFIFGRFSNFDKCQPEVAGDVMSSTALDYVGMDVPASFGDSQSNSGRIIRPFVRPDPFAHFCAVFSCILQPTGRS